MNIQLKYKNSLKKKMFLLVDSKIQYYMHDLRRTWCNFKFRHIYFFIFSYFCLNIVRSFVRYMVGAHLFWREAIMGFINWMLLRAFCILDFICSFYHFSSLAGNNLCYTPCGLITRLLCTYTWTSETWTCREVSITRFRLHFQAQVRFKLLKEY